MTVDELGWPEWCFASEAVYDAAMRYERHFDMVGRDEKSVVHNAVAGDVENAAGDVVDDMYAATIEAAKVANENYR